MSNETVVNATMIGSMTTSIISMIIMAARTAVIAATGMAAFQGEVTILSMIRGVSVTIVAWLQFGITGG